MRGPLPGRGLIGGALIGLGALILFARVLPPGFWWFCVGAALVAAGLLVIFKKNC